MPPKAKPTVYVRAPNDFQVFKSESAVISSLTKAGETIILNAKDPEPEGCLKGFVSDDISSYVKVVGLIDLKVEIARIQKRQTQISKLKEGLQNKISLPSYQEKTPEKIKKENDEKMAGYVTEIAELDKQMETLSKLA